MNNNVARAFESAKNYEPPNSGTKASSVAPASKASNLRRSTRKRIRKNVSSTSRRLHPEKRARAATTAPTVKDFTIKDSIKYVSEINKMPVYLVNGHACLCALKGECYVKGVKPIFKLPTDSYMLSFVIPEEFFCMKDPERLIVNEYTDIRKMLLVHSASDIQLSGQIGKKKHSLLGQLKRATGGVFDGARLQYPNVAFTFNEYEGKGQERTLVSADTNKYGVYRLDTLSPEFDGADLNNTMSILPQDASRPGNTWFLEDIIKEVKAKERVKKAIFILTGCFQLCGEKPPPADIDALQTIVELAHNAFNTLRPTVELSDTVKIKNGESLIPYNVGTQRPSGLMTIHEIMRMRNVTDPEDYLDTLSFMLHPEDREQLKKILEKESSK